MQIEVLLFGMYREFAGVDSTVLHLPPDSTASDAVEALQARGGGFARLPAKPAIAIDQEYAPLSSPLCDGAELALLPPIAGG